MECDIFIMHQITYLIGVLRRTQECHLFIYTRASSIMGAGNQAVPEGKKTAVSVAWT